MKVCVDCHPFETSEAKWYEEMRSNDKYHEYMGTVYESPKGVFYVYTVPKYYEGEGSWDIMPVDEILGELGKYLSISGKDYLASARWKGRRRI